MQQAVVFAESGTTVKMRKEPSSSCRTYWDIPIGTIVDVYESGDTWSRISTGERSGWMRTAYLQPIDSGNSSEGEGHESVQISRDLAEMLLAELTKAL